MSCRHGGWLYRLAFWSALAAAVVVWGAALHLLLGAAR